MLSNLLDSAIEIAKKSTSNFKIGAAAYRGDGVLVSAKNGTAEYPLPGGHAEARLIKKLTPKSIIVVVRVRSDGSLGMSKPCQNCARLLRNRGVAEVWYTNNSGQLTKMTDF